MDEAEVDIAVTKTDAEGKFMFSGLPTALGYQYEVGIKFQGAEYNSERLSFNEGETTKSTEVIVYDSTTSDKAIKIAMSHIIIYIEEDTLLVKEYYLFANETDRTYIGSDGKANTATAVLFFSLPEAATELQSTMGLMDCCIVIGESGFIDTMPVLPGMKEVSYSYRVNQSSGKYTLSQMIYYPTDRFDLLIQGEDIQANSDQLSNDEPMHINGIHYDHLVGQEIAAGQTLIIQLSGLPRTESQRGFWWIFLILIVICAFSIPFYLRKKTRLHPVSNTDDLSLHKQQLLAELAELDDDFEDGGFPEEAYCKSRAEKKAELLELMQRQKQG